MTKSLTFKAESFVYLYCIILLLLPLEIINITSVYSIETPVNISYKYRTFDYSFLVIPVVLYAFFLHNKTRSIHFEKIIALISIKDTLLYFYGGFNEMTDFDLSLYFSLLIGWAINAVIMKQTRSDDSLTPTFIIDLYFFAALGTMVIRIFLGLATFGRFGAIGLSVGGTGFFSGVYLIYLMFARKYTPKTPLLMTIAFLTLIFTGQRTNLFIVLIFSILYIAKIFFNKKQNNNSETFFQLLIIIILTFVSFLIIVLGEKILNLYETENFTTRTIEAIQKTLNGNLSSDDSVDGRARSIEAGINILTENPLGISNCFYDLQFRMLELQYPTFPHSTFLSCLLLWSFPITLICLSWMSILAVKLYTKQDGFFFVLIYILILLIVWNGPFLDYPMVFITIFFLSLANDSLREKQVLSIVQSRSITSLNEQNAI